MERKLDTRITPESLERNFAILNQVLTNNNKFFEEIKVGLSEEQRQRIAEMDSAVKKVNEFINQRIIELNKYINDLLISQQELAINIDAEIRETITSVETAINATIDEVKNVDIPELRNTINDFEADMQEAINTIKTVDMPNLESSLNDAITALDTAKVSHVEFNDQVNTLVQADEDNRSLITQTADSITAVVGELNKNAVDCEYTAISQIKQQADGIELMVADKANQSDLDVAADAITAIVINLNHEPDATGYNAISKIKQQADSIQVVVTANKTEVDGTIQSLNTQITAIPGQITSAVTQTKTDITNNQIAPLTEKISIIEQSVDGIRSVVASNKDDLEDQLSALESEINQGAGEITSMVVNLNTDPFTNEQQPYNSFTKIKQTADLIQATISANKTAVDGSIETLNTQINAVPGQITSAVTQTKNDITDNQINPLTQKVSIIEQSVDGIRSIVASNKDDLEDQLNALESEINQGSGEITSTVMALNTDPFTNTVQPFLSFTRIKQTSDQIQSIVATKAEASSLQITNNSISAIVTELNKPPQNCAYSAITALKDQVDLAVQGTDLSGEMIVSRINLSPAGVKIAGKMIEVNGDTVFQGNVDITGKLTASNLGSLSGGVIGTLRTATTGARVEIKDNLIAVYDANNTLRVRMGIW